MGPKQLVQSTFRGIGQVMFQNNAVTGLLFLAGIFIASWIMGIGATIGVLCGTLTAVILGYPQKEILDGLYGFNATLVGLGLLFFFEPSIVLFAILIIASALSTVVMNIMQKKKLHPYTFPFVIVTWTFIAIIKYAKLAVPTTISASQNTAGKAALMSGINLGISQVMFISGTIVGIIFFIGILFNSRTSALYTLLGSIVGLFIGIVFFPESLALVGAGIFGYNAVLCAIALGGRNWLSMIFAVIGVMLSVLILYGFMILGLVALTAPFVFATWITLYIENKTVKRNTA